MIRTITVLDLKTSLAKDSRLNLIDVRSAAEFAAGHVSGARHVPLDRLDAAQLAAESRDRQLHVICQGGVRSRKACEQLEAAGLAEVVDVAGGTNAWKMAGLPLEGSGRSVFGIDRQVRTIIGIGVLTGAVLAATTNPAWIYLSGFFGAGLLMAGLTDLCPLALLIAAMPWNRSATSTGDSCCAPAVNAVGSCCGK